MKNEPIESVGYSDTGFPCVNCGSKIELPPPSRKQYVRVIVRCEMCGTSQIIDYVDE